jgi:hypothetical protein
MTELAIIEKMVVEAKTEADEYLEALGTFEVVDGDTAEIMLEIAQDAHNKHKEYDTARQEITRPQLEAKRKVDALFKPVLDVLSKVKNIAKSKVVSWEREQEAARRKALESEDFSKAAALSTTASKPAMSSQQVWAWEEEDFSKIPREFLCIDNSAVNIAIRESADPSKLDIPGIRIFRTERYRLPTGSK